jgi:hypothetical protein
MARTGKLSAVKVTKAKWPAVLHDGGGLYLRGLATGNKSWVFRFQPGGKRHDMGLGSYPDYSLAEARSKATAHQKQLNEGIDPIDAEATQRQAHRLPATKGRTFREVAEEFIGRNEAGWRNTPSAVAQHARKLRLPQIGRIAGRRDRYRARGASARSDLDREGGNCEPGARTHRDGARRG